MALAKRIHCFLGLLTLAGWLGTVRGEQVVISELMYHPPGGLPEYLELSNLTATPQDIANWRFTQGIAYEFPAFYAARSNLTFLRPFERIVIASAGEAETRAAYRIPAGVRIYGPWTGKLADGGDRITLKDKNGVTVCSLAYGDRGHWSPAPDGAGHSLVLRDPDRSIDDWRNWTVSAERLGTPGTEPPTATETAVANPEVNLSQGLVLLDYGDRWSYHDGNLDLGTAWRAMDYPDADWQAGPGLLGKEESALPAPGLQTGINMGTQLTYYFRTRFVFQGDPARATLQLDQVVDDGAAYYLNGEYLGQVALPQGDATTFTNIASRTVGNAVEELNIFPVENTHLRRGTNVLAVEVHQNSSGSSDLVFGARLTATVQAQTLAGVLINEVFPGDAGVGFLEFYNPGATAVSLEGYYVTDTLADLRKFRLTGGPELAPLGLGSVGWAECGLNANNPVAVYLVAPDGASIVNAIRANLPADGRSLGRKPAGASSWYLFSRTTRDRPNTSASTSTLALRLNEVRFTPTNALAWVELYNAGTTALPLSGLALASQRDFSDRQPLSGSVPSQGYLGVEAPFAFANNELTLYLVDPADQVVDCGVFERPVWGDTLQAFPDGGGEWYASTNSTWQTANQPERFTDVVINEIMYDPPSNQTDGEYLELFNRGAEPVDLSDWRLAGGISFRFPAGTSLSAGGYLVVAANAARLRAVYGDIPVVGDWRGRLGNRGNLVRLLDARGNLADEVDYHVRGDWPDLAKGAGSSMELLNPWMDNRQSSAWADSDEANKAPMRAYSCRGTYTQLRTLGNASDYKEIYFHLVNEGHVILENVQFIKVSAGTNMILRGDTLSTNGASATGWLCQGTHAGSYMNERQLHIVADGRGDNRANRVEIDVPGLNTSDVCELRFNARWISGSPRLIFSTWDHSVANSFGLEVPDHLGTPGRANSRLLPAPAPQVDELRHSPPVPRSTNNVRVQARVVSADPLASVVVVHRPDNVNGNATWASSPMYDDGVRGGDEVAGDGLYSAELTQYKSNAQVVQFYVRAQTTTGQTCLLPRWGAAKPALYVVDDSAPPLDLRLVRVVVSAYDLDAISNGNSAKYRYRFPRLANHYKNATVIVNERTILYGAEVRNSGSPWTRSQDLSRGKWKVPDDRRYRGHLKFFFDNDPEAGRLFNNRLVRYWLYLIGHPVGENEFVRFKVNTNGPNLREDTEPVADDYLDRNFENGGQGDLYRIDDEWWFTDAWNSGYRDADWSYKNSDNPGRYRTEWMKRSNEDEDDFSALIGFFKTVSGSYSQADIERWIDPCATMKMFVVRGYVDDWDSFSTSRGKNGYFYRRASDGRFQFLHWDSDLTFGNASSALYNGVARVNAYISKPYNLRLFYYYLAEMIDNYTQNSTRLHAWLQAEEDASSAYSASIAIWRTWCQNRNNTARSRLGTAYTRPFAILTNGGQPLSVPNDTLTLEGSAPAGVFTVSIEGHPEATLTWSNLTNWSLSGVRLRHGENGLTVRATDQWGLPVRHAGTNLVDTRLTVTLTGNAPPVVELEAHPGSWHVPAMGSLELDARNSRDPEGGTLSFAWSAGPPAPAGWDTNRPGQAVLSFGRPGLYPVGLTVADGGGGVASLRREAAVYGPTGFSDFGATTLEPYWNLLNVEWRDNYTPGPWASLRDAPGQLTVQSTGDTNRPLAGGGPRYSWVWRATPSQGEWALETKLALQSLQFGDFLAGLLVEAVEAGLTNLYAIGLDRGTAVAVKMLAADGTVTTLSSSGWSMAEAVLRIRRMGESWRFEQKVNQEWQTRHERPLEISALTPRAGLLVASPAVQALRVGFAYALLVDPAETSDLRENLVVSELMYNPVEGDACEYIELANVGTSTLDLTGVRFVAGITYTFGNTRLGPGERLVIVRDRAGFAARYGVEGIRLADDVYGGRLDNGGERLTLVDPAGRTLADFSYGDGGSWPGRADGFGSSLELINPRGDLGDGANWRASSEYGGSPGRAGAGPRRSVVLNEVLAHTDPPLEDAIELYNPTAMVVDVGGWFLSDNRADYRKFRIPDGTRVLPGGYAVFYEDQFNLNNPRVPFALSSARGDDVHLTAADPAGNLTWFIDHVEFGPSANSVSFGRFPNGVGPLVAMSQRTFGSDVRTNDPPEAVELFRAGPGAENSYPKVGPLVFSHIMYHPREGGDEYVILLNVTDSPLPLFDPLAPTNSWRLDGGVEYTFPTHVTLGPRESVLISGLAPAAFRAKYGATNVAVVLGPWLGSLDNAGESLELYQPDPPQTLPPDMGYVPYVLVERVRYNNRWPWPQLADGFGPPLVRIMPTAYGDDPANWTIPADDPERDSDRDGMPDWWELANGLNPDAPADALADNDGDGLSNLAEFVSGTDPRDSRSRLSLEVRRLEGDMLRFEFVAAAGKSYTLETCEAVGRGPWTKCLDVPAQATSGLVGLTNQSVGVAGSRFYRLTTPARP